MTEPTLPKKPSLWLASLTAGALRESPGALLDYIRKVRLPIHHSHRTCSARLRPVIKLTLQACAGRGRGPGAERRRRCSTQGAATAGRGEALSLTFLNAVAYPHFLLTSTEHPCRAARRSRSTTRWPEDPRSGSFGESGAAELSEAEACGARRQQSDRDDRRAVRAAAGPGEAAALPQQRLPEPASPQVRMLQATRACLLPVICIIWQRCWPRIKLEAQGKEAPPDPRLARNRQHDTSTKARQRNTTII